jgi:hypothetical protein
MAEDFVPIGEQGVVKANYWGCSNKDDLEKLKQLIHEQDWEAVDNYGGQKGCVVLKTGDTGTVEDVSIWYADTCLRKRGNPECMWFPTPLVTKAP